MSIRNKKLHISFKLSFLAMFLWSILLLIFSFYTQGSLSIFFFEGSINFKVIFLNLFPILLFQFLWFFLSNSLSLSIVVNGCIFIIASLVNKYKILLRQDPFIPSDLKLFKESFSVIQIASIELKIVFFLFAIIILSFLLIYLVKNDKLDVKPRLISFLLLLAVAIFANASLYTNEKLYTSVPIDGFPYFEVNVYKSKGFIYNFIYDSNHMKVQKPLDYSPEIVSAIMESYTAEIPEYEKKPPNIIVIMGEAFSDLSINEHFDFSDYYDPLESYKKILEVSLHGDLYVPNIGGGTADTEFEVLTGMSTSHFRSAPYSYRMINKDLDAIPSELRSLSYETVGIHPGEPWFYIRQNVYPFMGFDKTLFIDDFSEDDLVAGYMSEKATIDKVISETELVLKESENPLFLFCVTIQNHGLYAGKYAAEKNFDTDVELSDEHLSELYNYFHGLRDVDIEIQRLYDYINSQDEEFIVVYFGDHLPGFSYTLYQEFPFFSDDGEHDMDLNKFKVPYFIFSNESAKHYLEDAEEQKSLSSNYLLVYLMSMIGLEDLNPYYKHLYKMMQKIPVISDNIFLKEGIFTDKLTVDETLMLSDYHNFEYFLLN